MNGVRLPSRAEQEEMERRRERSARASQLMAAHMLRGCKMLADTCATCGCVLLETREGVSFCVACRDDETESERDVHPPVAQANDIITTNTEGGGPSVMEVPLDQTEAMYNMKTAADQMPEMQEAQQFRLTSTSQQSNVNNVKKIESTKSKADIGSMILLEGSNGVKIQVPSNAKLSDEVMKLICTALHAVKK